MSSNASGVAHQPVTLVVITKNEESNIERCLNSVQFAAQKIVVDSFSTDKTVELAQRAGAVTFTRDFVGYKDQKSFGCDQAGTDWILILDADEALTEKSAKEILHCLSGSPSADAFELPRLTYHMGRWIKHGGWHPDYQRRLFNRSTVRWKEQELHEALEANSVKRLKEPILHWGFKDLTHQIDTNNRYSGLGALELKRKGRSCSIWMLLAKPWSKFIECYFLKKGLLDGVPGFVIAVGAAYSMFLKWAKLWELELSARRPKSESKRES